MVFRYFKVQILRYSMQRKSSADLLAYHAEKSQKNQRDCKVCLSRHFVILCKCTISQSETNVTTQNLHRCRQRKSSCEKIGFIFEKVLDFLSLLWYVVVLTEKEAQHEENN